jgi:hypothetical protein
MRQAGLNKSLYAATILPEEAGPHGPGSTVKPVSSPLQTTSLRQPDVIFAANQAAIRRQFTVLRLSET